MKRFVDLNLDLNRLKTSLTNSRIAAKNNALYQTIFQLIDKVADVHENAQTQINTIIQSSSVSSGGGGSSVSGITGSGTNNVLTMFTGSTSIGDCNATAVSDALDLLP